MSASPQSTAQPTNRAADTVKDTSATRIARSAIVVIGILAFSKLFSLSEKWIGLDRFGIGVDWGTYAAANQLPEQLFTLIAGGALAYAFIPIFGSLLTQGNERIAWRLAANVLNTVFLAALTVSVFVFVTAPWLVANVIAPGFASPFGDPAVLRLPFTSDLLMNLYMPDRVMQTANLMRILLLSLMIFSMSGLVSGILHTHQHFILPAIAPILFDMGNLLGVAVLSRYWGIYGAAVGAVIGASLHLLIQVPGLIRTHARWQPILDWSDPELRTVIKLMIPRAAGLAISNMYLLIATNMASTIARETGVAAFNRGWTLMQLPQTLIGTAMGIVIFPTLAVLSAAGDLNGKRAAMSGSLRFILVASIPAALLMVTAGRPLVGVLEGGQFDTESANRVFLVLQMFALGIITHSGVEIVARSFYADKDMVTPLLVNVVELALFLVLASQFTQMFGVAGLALANSIAVGVELIILMVILRRKWNGIDERTLFTTTIKTIIASAVMGVVTLIAAPIVESVLPGGRFGLLAQAAVLIGLGGVVFLVVGFLLRMQELVELPQILLRRRRNPVPEAALGD